MNDFYNGGMHGPKYGDGEFISKQIDLLPISMQKKVRKRYGGIYLKLIKEDKDKCRYRANTWLRATVKKYKAVDDGSLF